MNLWKNYLEKRREHILEGRGKLVEISGGILETMKKKKTWRNRYKYKNQITCIPQEAELMNP